jgi:inorganic pyrophosphatase
MISLSFFANAEKTILNKVIEIPRWANAKLEVIGMHGYRNKELITGR